MSVCLSECLLRSWTQSDVCTYTFFISKGLTMNYVKWCDANFYSNGIFSQTSRQASTCTGDNDPISSSMKK